MTDDRAKEMLQESGLAASEIAGVSEMLGEVSRAASAVPAPEPSPELGAMLASPPVRRFAVRRRAAVAAGAAALLAGSFGGAAAAHVLPEPVQEFVTELPGFFAGGDESEPPPVPDETTVPTDGDLTHAPDEYDESPPVVTDSPEVPTSPSHVTTTPSTPPTPTSPPGPGDTAGPGNAPGPGGTPDPGDTAGPTGKPADDAPPGGRANEPSSDDSVGSYLPTVPGGAETDRSEETTDPAQESGGASPDGPAGGNPFRSP